MSPKFQESLYLVLVSEGVLMADNGRVDNPNDEGGRTATGITQADFDRFLKTHNLPKRDVYLASIDEWRQIYYDHYWEPMGCENYPAEIAYVVFDSSVLHGTGFTANALKAIAGSNYERELPKLSGPDMQSFLLALRRKRWERMQGRPSFPHFSAGWKKRLDDVDRNVRALKATK